MVYTHEKISSNLLKVEIEIEKNEALDAYEKACRTISENVDIAGFRRGKAPRPVVEKYAGVEKIKFEALRSVLPKIFSQIVTEQKLELIAEPDIEAYTFEPGQDVKVTAKFELKPEVELGKYKDLKIKAEKFQTRPNALQDELQKLVQQFTTTVNVTDRTSKSTDILVFDFDGSTDDGPIANGSAKNYMLDLNNSTFIPGFAEQLIDKPMHQEFTIEVTFPAEYHEESLKNKSAKFKITINEIKEKVLPELNDELAKKAGNFESLDALREDIQKYLDENEKQENERRAQSAIFDKVVADAKIEIPDSMIMRESQVILSESKQKIEARGLSWEQVMKNENQEEFLQKLKTEAALRIKNSLVIEKLAKLENIKADTNDFNAQIANLAQTYHTDAQTVVSQLSKNPSIINALSQQIIAEKVGDFLRGSNTIELT